MEFVCISCNNPLSEADLQLSMNLNQAGPQTTDTDEIESLDDLPFAKDSDNVAPSSFYQSIITASDNHLYEAVFKRTEEDPAPDSPDDEARLQLDDAAPFINEEAELEEGMAMCEQCFERLAGVLVSDIRQQSGLTQRYDEHVTKLAAMPTPTADVDLEALKEEERMAREEFHLARQGHNDLQQRLAVVSEETAVVQAETAELWAHINSVIRAEEEAAAAAMHQASAVTRLKGLVDRLQVGVMLTLFPIRDLQTHATICGLGLHGNWREANSALGQTAFLVAALLKKLGVDKPPYVIRPEGDKSTIAGLKGTVAPLYGGTGSNKRSKLNTGCCALLQCIGLVYFKTRPDTADTPVAFTRGGRLLTVGDLAVPSRVTSKSGPDMVTVDHVESSVTLGDGKQLPTAEWAAAWRTVLLLLADVERWVG